MKARGRRRAAFGAAILSLAVGVWIAMPRLLGLVPLFHVRKIELVGLHYLAPDPIVRALRLPPDASVFTDPDLLADRVRGVSGVAAAHITRHLPAAIEVSVEEIEPAAFVVGARGELLPVDAHGNALPFDPARSRLDLPVATTRDTAVLRILALATALDPAFGGAIMMARPLTHAEGAAGVALEMKGAEHVLVARTARARDLNAVVQVRRDLARRRRVYNEIDARFAGQIVVRRRRERGVAAGAGE